MTPFQNHIGLAERKGNEEKFKQISKAPILKELMKNHLEQALSVLLKKKKMENVVYMLFRVGRFFKLIETFL